MLNQTVLHVFSVVVAVLVLAFVIQLLRLGKLKERHAIWWILGSLLAVVFTIFPEALTSVSKFFGFGIPANFAFFSSIVILLIVAAQLTSEIVSLEEKTRILAEKIALLENKIDSRDK